jgi:predicted phosphodiesterase
VNRFGIIGDVHAEDILLAVALDRLANQQLDRILCVGDIADGPGSVDRCCQLLQRHDVATIAGNHDRWLLTNQLRDLPGASASDAVGVEARNYLAALPRMQRIETDAGSLLLCHGLGENDMAKVGPDDYGYALESNTELQRLMQSEFAFVICGHTHRRMVRRLGRLTVINAGTLRNEQHPCFGLVDLNARLVRWFELGPDGSVKESKSEEFAVRAAGE